MFEEYFDKKTYDLLSGQEFVFTDLYTKEELDSESAETHRVLGRMFHELYEVGGLPDIVCLGKNSRNHYVYKKK